MKITGKIQEEGLLKLTTFTGLTISTVQCEIVNNSFEFEVTEGIGHLEKDGRKLLIFLEDADLLLNLDNLDNTVFNTGVLNKQFEVYSKEYQKINQALSALYYLKTVNTSDEVETLIQTEKEKLVKGNDFYSLYCWLKHLVSSVFSVTANREEVVQHIEHFRLIDWSSPFLNKMDLLPELIEGQQLLIENSGCETIEEMFAEQNISIDALFNTYTFEILEYYFDTLEKRSLYPSAEHLANKALNEIEIIPKTLRYKFEGYRGSKKAVEAFNFQVSNDKMLHEIEGEKLLLFSDSNCSPCTDIMPSVINSVAGKDITLIVISDKEQQGLLHSTDETLFDKYFVYATPTMIIIDTENKLYLKPNSVEHLKAYLNTK